MIADIGVIVFALGLPTLVTLAYFVWQAEAGAAKQLAYSGGKLVQFALPLVWVLLVQRESLQFEPPTAAGVLLGLAFGAVVVLAMLALYALILKPRGYLDGQVRDEAIAKIRQFGLTTRWRYIALGVFYALGHSFLEEYYWRWFVFGQLTELTPFWWAVAISSLGFMAHHVILLCVYFGWRSPMTYVFSLAVAIGGAAWAWLYADSGSLLGPWLSHLLIDAAIFAIGYDLVGSVFRAQGGEG